MIHRITEEGIRPSFITLYHYHPLTNNEVLICNFASKMATSCACVCVCVCMCVCVCVYFLSPSRLLLTEQNNKCNARVQVSDGKLSRYYCTKGFCVKDNHRKNLQASNCAKEC